MRKKVKIVFSLLLVLVMLTSIIACAANGETQQPDPTPAPETGTGTATADPEPTDVPEELTIAQRLELMNTAVYSSELPDWTGPQLSLRAWHGHGLGDPTRIIASNDVISAEIARVTGVSIDFTNSFDNAGMDLESRIAVQVATGDFPEIGYNIDHRDLIRGDALYDLTDLIPVYAPIAYNRITAMAPGLWSRGFDHTGRHYIVRSSWWPQSVAEQVQVAELMGVDSDPDRIAATIQRPGDHMGWTSVFFIRDDILKMIYPEAKSQDELEAIFMQNGGFTRDQVYDVPIRSKDEFFDFMYRIREVLDENDVNVGGRPVYPTYVFQGGDNWWLCSFLIGQLNGLFEWNYYTQYDHTQGRIVMEFEQPFFRDDFRRLSAFVRDRITPASNLIEDGDTFRNRLDNGEFVLTYGAMEPSRDSLQAAGHEFRYRRMFLDIPQDTNRRVIGRVENGGHLGVSIFTDSVAEEDVPQVLMWVNFLMSPAGMDLLNWGPEYAGLWEWQADGSRKFVDPALEDAILHSSDHPLVESFNLISTDGGYAKNFPGIYPGIMAGGVFGPRYQYVRDAAARSPDQMFDFFQTGYFHQTVRSRISFAGNTNFWNYTAAIPEMERWDTVRVTGFEAMLTRCLAASSDAEFERLFDEALRFSQENGMTQDTLDAINAYVQENFAEQWAGLQGGN